MEDFIRVLAEYYELEGRHGMPWRQAAAGGEFEPYRILVSELMLQQTQVARVELKFAAFLERFKTVQDLAAAPLADVLVLWSGLGYNRRAKFLWQAAQVVVTDYGGEFPRTPDDLCCLPGVGPGTAGAIMAYAYDQPVVYLETNIRTVLIHHFFKDQASIPDAALRETLAEIVKTLPAPPDDAPLSKPFTEYFTDNRYPFTARTFYWAMMDYGSYLKKTIGNLSRASKSYAKQSRFEGSRRQIRGAVLRLLAAQSMTVSELTRHFPDPRTPAVLDDLAAEHLVVRTGDIYALG